MDTAEITCVALSEDNLPDLERFFAEDAFTNNPFAARCFCVFHYRADAPEAWRGRGAAENRALRRELVRGGQGHGVLAYQSDKVVGWVGVDLRPILPRYDQWGTPSDGRTGIVHCFVVLPGLRRQGVAGQLLGAACRHLSDLGVECIESYVVADPEKHADAVDRDRLAYHGPLSIYLRHGFQIVDYPEGQGFYTRVRRAVDHRGESSGA